MKKYWFKAKRYGWGWYPATWQGWLVLLGYFALLLVDATGKNIFVDQPSSDKVLSFVIDAIILAVILIFVCYKTGEKPRWRWGRD